MTHFVIGVDPQIVAGYLDQVYEASGRSEPVPHGDDPSSGWAFLRKLIQLPVIVPQVSDRNLEQFVDRLTGAVGTVQPPLRRLTQAAVPMPEAARSSPATAPPTTTQPTPVAARIPVETIPWRTLERHPDIHAALTTRLVAQPDRSLREAKRLINVWQMYVRLAGPADSATPAAAIRRAQHLLVLAEIVTRWPALQPPLHSRTGDRRGLHILAHCVADDESWHEAVRQLDIDPDRHHTAFENLRELLRDHDGHAVADLAGLLL